MVLSKLENRAFITWNDEQNIVWTRTKKGVEVNIDDARDNSELVGKVSGNKVSPLIVDLRELKSITHEAREHFSIRDRESKVTCIALIIKSPLSRIIGNFFMGINKPSVPTRLFIDEKTAVAWSLQNALQSEGKLAPVSND